MELIEQVALAMINRDRAAGGWPEVASRDTIANSDGYAECAEIAIATTFTHIREQADESLILQALEQADCDGEVYHAEDFKRFFDALLGLIEGKDND